MGPTDVEGGNRPGGDSHAVRWVYRWYKCHLSICNNETFDLKGGKTTASFEKLANRFSELVVCRISCRN
jgi:hypothetical protein